MAMYSFRDFISKFRHYFRFSKEEIEACIISVLAMAFIVSFNEWGYGSKFDFNIGLGNFLKAIIIVGIILGLQLIVIKTYAIYYGYRAEFKLWWYGIGIGLLIAFLSASLTGGDGKASLVWILAPGGLFFHHLAVHRLGWWRYGVNQMETGWTCMWGVLSTLMLGAVFKVLLYIFPTSTFFYKAMIVCLWFAFFSILPIPPLIGSRIFIWSRPWFFFIFGIVVGFNFILRLNISIFWIIVWSLIVGAVVWALGVWKVES